MCKLLDLISKSTVINILLISVFIVSCNSNQSGKSQYIVADIREEIDNPKILPLADEIESVTYIQLEESDNDDSLISGSLGFAITENYIYVHPMQESGIVLYDRQGHFLKTLIRYGQGPGEYNGTFIGIQADEKNDRLYVYSPERIFIYDLEGKHIKTHIPGYNYISNSHIGNNRFGAIGFPYQTFKQGNFGIGIFTEEGDTITIKNDFSSSLVPAEKAGFTLGMTPPAYSPQFNSVLFKTGSNDTIFRMSDDKIQPAIILDLKNSDDEIIRSLDATDFRSLHTKFEADGDIFVSDMFETANHYYLRLRLNKRFYVASVNKETGSTIVEKCISPGTTEDMSSANIQFGMAGTRAYNNFPVWGNIQGDYLVQIINPYELHLFKSLDSVTIPDDLQNVEEEGNPILILYKLKK